MLVPVSVPMLVPVSVPMHVPVLVPVPMLVPMPVPMLVPVPVPMLVHVPVHYMFCKLKKALPKSHNRIPSAAPAPAQYVHQVPTL